MNMLSKFANVPTIPHEQMEFWNATTQAATIVVAVLVVVAIIIVFALAWYNKEASMAAYVPVVAIVGAIVWVLLTGLPYAFINSDYVKEGSAQSLTELGYQNVSMDGFDTFTATKGGKYVTGQLADTPDEDAYFVIELSAVTVE